MTRNAFRNFGNIRAIDIIFTARARVPKRNSTEAVSQQTAHGARRTVKTVHTGTRSVATFPTDGAGTFRLGRSWRLPTTGSRGMCASWFSTNGIARCREMRASLFSTSGIARFRSRAMLLCLTMSGKFQTIQAPKSYMVDYKPERKR